MEPASPRTDCSLIDGVLYIIFTLRNPHRLDTLAYLLLNLLVDVLDPPELANHLAVLNKSVALIMRDLVRVAGVHEAVLLDLLHLLEYLDLTHDVFQLGE